MPSVTLIDSSGVLKDTTLEYNTTLQQPIIYVIWLFRRTVRVHKGIHCYSGCDSMEDIARNYVKETGELPRSISWYL